MITKIIILLLFMTFATFAVTAFAAGDRIDIAKTEQNLPLQKKHRIVATKVTEKNEYYEVRGNCEKELRTEMTKNGCAWSDGRKYDSVTTWKVTWEYGYDRGPRTCSADSFQAKVELVSRYPQWARNDDAPQPLVEKWNSYLQSLEYHENGHRELAVAAADELTRAVEALPPAPTCAALDQEIRTLSREYMRELDVNEKAYDEDTTHGVKQGALFP